MITITDVVIVVFFVAMIVYEQWHVSPLRPESHRSEGPRTLSVDSPIKGSPPA